MALDRKRLKSTRLAWRWTAFLVLYVFVTTEHGRFIPPSAKPWVYGMILGAFWVMAVWTLGRFVRDKLRLRRALREFRASGGPGRFPLGAPYAVELDMWDNGGRVPHVMSLDERGARFTSRGVLAGGFEFEGVDVVRVHAAWIELVSGDESVRVVPRSYADRERLLWELAFRWSDGVHRGIDETPPDRPHAPFVPPAQTADVESIAGGATPGLASALAGPMDRGNPAPPRKSGLGNGLFVAPPAAE